MHLRFPREKESPLHRLQKPEEGRYNLTRLIRRGLKLNVFGQILPVPPKSMYEYVVATIDAKQKKLKFLLEKLRSRNLITS